ncbi:MAG: hypothetical protein ACFB03_19535 [Paracoccaceae bacterium]
MPDAHLFYDSESGLVIFRDEPPAAGLKKHENKAICYFAPLFYDGVVPNATLDMAWRIFFARQGGLVEEVRDAANQLARLDESAAPNTGYVALGASPKLVKWALKSLGKPICTVTVSGIKKGVPPSEAFLSYLQGKISKLGDCEKIVVFDFADTGASLLKIKEDIESTCEKMGRRVPVMTAALGTSPQFHGTKNAENKAAINFEVRSIPNLQQALYKQNTKGSLGRNKVKNAYDGWSDERRGFSETHDKYQDSKATWTTLLGQGLTAIQLTEEDLGRLIEAPPSGDEDEFSSGWSSDEEAGGVESSS